MSKNKKSHPIRDFLLYLLVRTLAVFIQLGNVNTSLAVARGLGRGLFLIYHRGRERALTNIRLSYPEKTEQWHQLTARRSFEHLVMFAFDVLYAPRLIRTHNWYRYIELGDMRKVLQLLLQGQGLIMVTGHYGNFEVLGRTMDAFGLPTYNIARPIDNPYINRYVYEILHRPETIIFKKGATEAMDQILGNGKALGIVGDQNGKVKDVFVNFFGRKAATYKSIALMALQYNVPIVVGCARRIGDQFKFHLDVSRIIMPKDWQSQDNPIVWITEQWTQAIETFVRKDPQQYWWVHRRWKTRPPEERRNADCVILA
ncbi:MAG: hypothetical protein JW936_11435 [Sedimentisphaerales bacterium]|nr:hypothetical protein [Sedimentisphaerales bacterium]